MNRPTSSVAFPIAPKTSYSKSVITTVASQDGSKKTKAGEDVLSSKAKEMLVLQDLSGAVARKFEAALKSIITKVRYTGSPYHRLPGSKEGPVATRSGFVQ
jgi:hypothetical protein